MYTIIIVLLINTSIISSGLAIFLDPVGVRERVAIMAEKKHPQTQRQHYLNKSRHSARTVHQVCMVYNNNCCFYKTTIHSYYIQIRI